MIIPIIMGNASHFVARTKVKRGGGGKIQAVDKDGHLQNPFGYHRPPKKN
jgi:hypothetical protein